MSDEGFGVFTIPTSRDSSVHVVMICYLERCCCLPLLMRLLLLLLSYVQFAFCRSCFLIETSCETRNAATDAATWVLVKHPVD